MNIFLSPAFRDFRIKANNQQDIKIMLKIVPNGAN